MRAAAAGALLGLVAPRPALAGKYLDKSYKTPEGSSKALKLDLWTPPDYPCGADDEPANATSPASPTPLIIFLYGGAWTEGSKSLVCGTGYECGPVVPNVARKTGSAVVAMNYRLTSESWGSAPVSMPAQIQDVIDAANWVLKDAAKYHIDTSRVVCEGESAGAHLCALLATYSTWAGGGPPPAPPPADRFHCDEAAGTCAAAAAGHSTLAKCEAACGAPPPPAPPAPPAAQAYACVVDGGARACRSVAAGFPGSYPTLAACSAACKDAAAAAPRGLPNGPAPLFPLKAALNFFAPTDILRMEPDAKKESCSTLNHDASSSPESKLMGNAGPHKSGLGIGDIRGGKAKYPKEYNRTVNSNPITFVDARSPPMFLRHGSCDPLVPHAQTTRLEQALKSAGVEVDSQIISGASHMCQPRAVWNSHIQAGEKWLEQQLK